MPPPQDADRAAFASLLGPCCFLPPVPAAFPGAFSLFPVGLRLLPSPPSFFVRWPPLLFSPAVVSFGLLFGPRCVWPRVVGVGVVFGFLLGLFLPSLFVVFLLVVWWADWLLAH